MSIEFKRNRPRYFSARSYGTFDSACQDLGIYFIAENALQNMYMYMYKYNSEQQTDLHIMLPIVFLYQIHLLTSSHRARELCNDNYNVAGYDSVVITNGI